VATEPTIGILAQRRIEAAFAKGIFEEMTAELGAEKAAAILERAIIKLAEQAGALAAAETPTPGIEHFAEILPRWTKDDALQIEILEKTPEKFDFNVKRCRYAETYREMGLGPLGAILSCNRDAAFCVGYDPKLKLTRTQTIMGGASHCDFRYRREA
jgi:hypothetical protein